MFDVAAYPVFVCALFPVQGGKWTAVHITPCTGNIGWCVIFSEYYVSHLLYRGSQNYTTVSMYFLVVVL